MMTSFVHLFIIIIIIIIIDMLLPFEADFTCTMLSNEQTI